MFDKLIFQFRSYNIIQHIKLRKNLVYLAITNLKYKDYNNFYQFLLLLSGDVSLNPGPVQITPAVNSNIWKQLNKNLIPAVYFRNSMN